MKTRNIAFTLIELLVVIAIIGILAGLLFPAFTKTRLLAKQAAAKTQVQGLSIALQAYYNEYGAWPDVSAGTSVDKTLTASQNAMLVRMLDGEDCTLDITPVTPGGNPRKIQFLRMPASSKGLVSGIYTPIAGANLLNLVSPWKNSIMVAFDYNSDNNTALPSIIDNPMGFTPSPTDPSSTNAHVNVAVWTCYPQGGTNAFITSW